MTMLVHIKNAGLKDIGIFCRSGNYLQDRNSPCASIKKGNQRKENGRRDNLLEKSNF